MNVCAHWQTDRWEAYIDDRISELQRAEMEACLEFCGSCLENYTRLIENRLNDDFAEVDNGADIEERVMQAIFRENIVKAKAGGVRIGPKRVPKIKRRRMKSTLVHYLIAASITLLFMGGGAFDAFAEGSRLNTTQNEVVSKAYAWNGHLVDKAKNWVHFWTTTSGRDTF